MVKISDVAQHADVSPSTVSYVLSGKRSISARTRQRVLDSIATLGYRPHAGGRALPANKSNVIALAVPLRPGTYVPVMMQIAQAWKLNDQAISANSRDMWRSHYWSRKGTSL